MEAESTYQRIPGVGSITSPDYAATHKKMPRIQYQKKLTLAWIYASNGNRDLPYLG